MVCKNLAVMWLAALRRKGLQWSTGCWALKNQTVALFVQHCSAVCGVSNDAALAVNPRTPTLLWMLWSYSAVGRAFLNKIICFKQSFGVFARSPSYTRPHAHSLNGINGFVFKQRDCLTLCAARALQRQERVADDARRRERIVVQTLVRAREQPSALLLRLDLRRRKSSWCGVCAVWRKPVRGVRSRLKRRTISRWEYCSRGFRLVRFRFKTFWRQVLPCETHCRHFNLCKALRCRLKQSGGSIRYDSRSKTWPVNQTVVKNRPFWQ